MKLACCVWLTVLLLACPKLVWGAALAGIAWSRAASRESACLNITSTPTPGDRTMQGIAAVWQVTKQHMAHPFVTTGVIFIAGLFFYLACIHIYILYPKCVFKFSAGAKSDFYLPYLLSDHLKVKRLV
ncbi:MAG: hypothetical protein ACRC4N_05840 [Gammaproteobacteria bacterium]